MSPAPVVAMLFSTGPMSILVKVTATLVVASAVAAGLTRASAAGRHLVWFAALVACGSLALIAPVAPPIAILTAWLPSTPAPRVLSATPGGSRIDAGEVRSSVTEATSATPATTLVASAHIAVGPPMVMRVRSWTLDHWGTLATLLWLAGFVVVIGQFMAGLHGVARLLATSTPLDSDDWRRDLEVATRSSHLERPVRLLMSESSSSPITFGALRPAIVLPADASSWTTERRRVVLVHELAHVARMDFAAQLIATITTAIFWFHPLVWFAGARLRAEAEQAADDFVIAGGTPGVAYASHLLEIARGVSRSPMSAAVAVGMMRSSRLETRFRAMLDARRSRAAVSSRLRVGATAAVLGVMIPFAGLRTAAVASPAPSAAPMGSPTAYSSSLNDAASALRVGQTSTDSVIEHTIDARPGRMLMLELATGAGVKLHAWDQSRIRMRGDLGGADWRDARITLERAGDDVRLRSLLDGRESGAVELALEIWVPRRTDVELRSAGGSVEVDSVSGSFTGETGGGSITMNGASGRAALSTGGGRILVLNSDLAGTITTGYGEVVTRNSRGSLTASSSPGSSSRASTGREPFEDYPFEYPKRPNVGIGVGRSGTGYPNAYPTGDVAAYGRSGTGYAYAYPTADAAVSGGVAGGISYGVSTNISHGVGVGFGYGAGACSASIASSNGTNTVSVGSSGESRTITNTTTNTYINGIRVGTGTGTADIATTRAGSPASIHKAGGSIDLDDAPFGATVSTGGGRINIGSSSGAVVASTGGGDIELGNLAGDAVASTGSGTVVISVVNIDGTEHSISVCDGSGQVVLELPAQLDARVELETAYTDNFGRETNINSDLSLTRSETSDWDDRAGTPRKYVRARGSFGSGRGLIRVQTVNGDIIIRRR